MSSDTIFSQIKATPHTWALVGIGIVSLFVILAALKIGKFVVKCFLVLIALGLVAGAVWWHIHKH